MMKTIGFGLATVALVWATPAFALPPEKALTQYTTTTWAHDEGLPADMVRCIAQTSDGFLWIGTDEGLARFDGHEFTVIGTANGTLPSDFVTTLAAARDGSLWIGTQEGLVHYAAGRFTTLGAKEGFPNVSIAALHEDREGTLWVAAGNALYTIRNGSARVISAEKLAPLTFPHAFLEDRQGTLWISGDGLVRREGTGFVPILGPAHMHGLIANALAQAPDGTLWIGGNKGMLARTADGQVRVYDTADRLPNSLVRALWIDGAGVLWAGTNGGVIRFEGNRFALQPVFPDHDRLSVRSLFEDREGNLWMGSSIGLSRFRDSRFTSFGQPEGWPADAPTAVLADRAGDLWVGYHDSGLLQVSVTPTSARVKKLFTVHDGLISNEIFSIREARNGDLLIGTRRGLSRLHHGHFENTTIVDRLQRPLVLDVLEDSSGQIFVAGSRDVSMKEGRDWRILADIVPVVLSEGAGGDVWAGANGTGLWRLSADGHSQHFSKADGLGSNRVRALYRDEAGILWLGTFGGGLIRFDGKQFHSFTTHDGLPSDNVTHIARDGGGYLWLSTTRGIARVAKSDLEALAQGRLKTLPVNVYGPDDGLRSLQTGPSIPVGAGGTRTRDGRLWFIAGMSVAAIDENISDSQEPLSTVVEASAGGKSLDAAGEARIEPGSGPVQLRFTGLHLRAPQRVRYQYQLEGLDTQWSDPTNLRSLTYSSLSPGHYRFRVRALLGGQRSPEASFAFMVLPRFYQTAWFVWLCVAALGASAYGAYQWRQRLVHARFAIIITERTRLAREIHDTLAQGFFGITSQLDALSTKLDNPHAVRRELNLARSMARHSLAEARRSVMDLRMSELKDATLSEALASSARQWTEGLPIEIKLNLGKTDALRPDVAQHILRIAQEAVANAMKHARPSSIGIDLHLQSRQVMLRVQDDGCGFEATRTFSDTDGHFGLIGMQERAHRIGAKLQISSRPGRGTIVEVAVPV